jgi:hypothetical protein
MPRSLTRPSRVLVGALASTALVALPASAGEGHINSSNGDADFTVNFRYPPTPQQVADVKAAIDLMALGVCDATDGQIRIHKVKLTQGQASEDLGDYWLDSRPFRSGVSTASDGSNLGRLGRTVVLDRFSTRAPDVWLHEWGHHAFGLGEQYDEQRRYDGPCGIGPGFDAGGIDERNHSIMQQSGGARCVGGAADGSACLRSSDCPPAMAGGAPGTCQLVLMSELSAAVNHDPIRSTSGACPSVVPLGKATLSGPLPAAAAVMTFDAASFDTAKATSTFEFTDWRAAEIIDAKGGAPGARLSMFLTHTGPGTWLVSAAVDGATVGGTAGSLALVEQWTLAFNADGSLASISEDPPSLTLSPLATGAADLTVAMSFGTPNPTAAAGAGMDGLREQVSLSEPTLTTNSTQPLCDAATCKIYWNATRNRYETSMQSEFHGGLSDWETLAQNYSFVTAPAGLPQADPPAKCFRAVQYEEMVQGSDQVLLVLDKSGSMNFSAKDGVGEVCGNMFDDDRDGTVDEPDCGDPRMNFVKDAASAYVDLQRDNSVDVGILTFDHLPPTLQRPIGPLNAGNIADFKAVIDGIKPGGGTAIGDALDASAAEFARVAAVGRSRTAYLMTDGYNTHGVPPAEAAARLEDIGVRVHVIPAGSDVKEVELSTIASRTGGGLFPTPAIGGLSAVFAELAARHQGAALVVPRIDYTLDASNSARVFIPVEKNAQELTAFVGGRNPRMSEWGVKPELMGPNGERFGPGSKELTVNPHYLFIRVPQPSPGQWVLMLSAARPDKQQLTALAFVRNPDPDLFASTHPTLVAAGGSTTVAADPLFVTRLGNRDVAVTASVHLPLGPPAAVAMQQNAAGSWEGRAGPFLDNGFYDVTVQVDAGPHASLTPGEPIFPGPRVPAVDFVPFHRAATTTFVVSGGTYPCLGRNKLDCDSDGILDRQECPGFPPDIDGDGRPNGRDPDADGDEMPDSLEGMKDSNRNRVPDMCEVGPKRKGGPIL